MPAPCAAAHGRREPEGVAAAGIPSRDPAVPDPSAAAGKHSACPAAAACVPLSTSDSTLTGSHLHLLTSTFSTPWRQDCRSARAVAVTDLTPTLSQPSNRRLRGRSGADVVSDARGRPAPRQPQPPLRGAGQPPPHFAAGVIPCGRRRASRRRRRWDGRGGGSDGSRERRSAGRFNAGHEVPSRSIFGCLRHAL